MLDTSQFFQVWQTAEVQKARMIADLAHGAVGQKRADGVTPYIVHPMRVMKLAFDFTSKYESGFMEQVLIDRMIGGLLHDVLEDTKLTISHLGYYGISASQIDIVLRLTKPDPHGKAPESYYTEIAKSQDALVVKCADRCANLEDALAEVLVEEPTEPRRWGRYVEDTSTHILPLYASLPWLRKEIEDRLGNIEEALPAALERRAIVVARQRSKVKNDSGDQGVSQSGDAGDQRKDYPVPRSGS